MNTRDCDLSNNNIRRAVILTPAGRGAVATILVEGDDADRLVSRYFHPASGKPLTEIPIGHIIFGRWTDGDGAGEETVVCCRSANCVEVNCHGGRIAAEAVMRTLEQAGCEAMRWQDWVSRTESDPISAEARQALAAASTLRAAGILLDQYRGALRSAMISIIDYLHRNEITEAVNQLNELLRHANVGLHLVQPWRGNKSLKLIWSCSSSMPAGLGVNRTKN